MINNIVVIGSGVMGRGIAYVSALEASKSAYMIQMKLH